jgi:hypothetical protein
MRIFTLIILITFLLSCTKQETLVKDTSISIQLSGNPANYEAVFINITCIDIHQVNESGEEAWITLGDFNKGIYDILDYCNGKDTLLVSTDFPSGKISQIRLLLGAENFVIVNGETYELIIPSGYTSGLKLNFHETIEPGIEKQIWLNFDADKSITVNGSGKYKMDPVIRVYSSSSSGSIKGTVNPVESLPRIYVENGSDTFVTIADFMGYFYIGGIPEGNYKVRFEPTDPYLIMTIDNANVVNGECNNLGEISITK